MIIEFCGLPAAGKSTLSVGVEKRLHEHGIRFESIRPKQPYGGYNNKTKNLFLLIQAGLFYPLRTAKILTVLARLFFKNVNKENVRLRIRLFSVWGRRFVLIYSFYSKLMLSKKIYIMDRGIVTNLFSVLVKLQYQFNEKLIFSLIPKNNSEILVFCISTNFEILQTRRKVRGDREVMSRSDIAHEKHVLDIIIENFDNNSNCNSTILTIENNSEDRISENIKYIVKSVLDRVRR